MTPKVLPLELHGECLSHIASDRVTLHTASLVCKHWLHQTRPYILNDKYIMLENTFPRAADRILDLLSSPYCSLQSYILRAYLFGYEYGAFDPETKGSDDDYDRLNLLITQYLSKLRRLKRLMLTQFTWQRLSYEARSCLVSSFPDLETIGFEQVAFPTPLDLVDTIISFHNTNGLRLSRPIFDDSTVFNDSAKANASLDKLLFPHLTFLDINFGIISRSFASPLLSGIRLPNIKTLCISQFDEDCSVIKQALEVLGPSLEHLALHPDPDSYPFDLSALKVLKILEIADNIDSPAVAHLLQSIQSQHFRELHLSFWAEGRRDAVEQLWEMNSYPKSTRQLYLKYPIPNCPKVMIPEDMRKSIEVVEVYEFAAASVFQGWHPYD